MSPNVFIQYTFNLKIYDVEISKTETKYQIENNFTL